MARLIFHVLLLLMMCSTSLLLQCGCKKSPLPSVFNVKNNPCAGVDPLGCCGVDRFGEVWTAARNKTITKQCGITECGTVTWYCTVDGYFETEEPDYKNCCTYGMCTLGGDYFVGIYGSYAYRPCDETEGFKRLMCGYNGIFISYEPDTTECCNNQCRAVDESGYVWIACPGNVAQRRLPCLNQPNLYADITWECGTDGFKGLNPNYQNCECTKKCVKSLEEYEWTACVGDIAEGPCMSKDTGVALWYCGMEGTFINERPDYSKCTPQWVFDLQEQIDYDDDPCQIMNNISERTDISIPTGLENIVGLFSSLLEMFEIQSYCNFDTFIFDEYTGCYAKTLTNIMRDTTAWSSMVDSFSRLRLTYLIYHSFIRLALSLASNFNQTAVNHTMRITWDELVYLEIVYTNAAELRTDWCNDCSISVSVDEVDSYTFIYSTLAISSEYGQYMLPTSKESKKNLYGPVVFLGADKYKEKQFPENMNDDITVKLTVSQKKRSGRSDPVDKRLRLESKADTPSLESAQCVCWNDTEGIWFTEGSEQFLGDQYNIGCRWKNLSHDYRLTLSIISDPPNSAMCDMIPPATHPANITDVCKVDDPKSCCARDGFLNVWTGPHNTTIQKPCSQTEDCGTVTWSCSPEFGTEEPDYRGCLFQGKCARFYPDLKTTFESIPGTYAYGPCSSGHGTSKWLCGNNGEFIGDKPDFSQCCESKPCYGTDSSGFMWIACPTTIHTRRLPCPSQPELSADITWECSPGGFYGETPNYKNCKCLIKCSEKYSSYNWTGCAGDVVKGPCLGSETGSALWSCGQDGHFIGTQPDYSKCKPEWVNDIDDQIDNGEDSEDIIEDIEDNTSSGVTGIDSVTDVLDRVVDLFVKQSEGSGDVSRYDKFTETYVTTLANVVTNETVWSSMVNDEDRLQLTTRITQTTQKLVFSLSTIFGLNSTDFFNKTFTEVEKRGLGMSILYSTSPNNTQLQLDPSSVNCSVLWTTNHTDDEDIYVSYNLIFSQTFGQYMFPVSKEDQIGRKIVTGPIVTTTVGKYSSNKNISVIEEGVDVEVILHHKVTVRSPSTTVIYRRLYDGEEPSAVVDSSRCMYWDYSNGSWSSEGCVKVTDSKQQVRCQCGHLSTFSSIMDVHEYVPDVVLEVLSIIMMVFPILNFILTIYMLVEKKKFVTETETVRDIQVISIHLCFCLFLGHTLVLLMFDKKYFLIPDVLCSVIGGLLHYVFTTAFAWVLIQGHYLYWKTISNNSLSKKSKVNTKDIMCRFMKNGNISKMYKYYMIFGYAGPIAVILLTIVVGFGSGDNPYGNDEICWLALPNYVWFFMTPVTVIVVINLVLLLLTWTETAKKNKDEKDKGGNFKLKKGRKVKEEKFFKAWTIGMLTMSVVIFLTWYFGLAVPSARAFSYLFVLFNGLQAVYMIFSKFFLCVSIKDKLYRLCSCFKRCKKVVVEHSVVEVKCNERQSLRYIAIMKVTEDKVKHIEDMHTEDYFKQIVTPRKFETVCVLQQERLPRFCHEGDKYTIIGRLTEYPIIETEVTTEVDGSTESDYRMDNVDQLSDSMYEHVIKTEEDGRMDNVDQLSDSMNEHVVIKTEEDGRMENVDQDGDSIYERVF